MLRVRTYASGSYALHLRPRRLAALGPPLGARLDFPLVVAGSGSRAFGGHTIGGVSRGRRDTLARARQQGGPGRIGCCAKGDIPVLQI